MKPETKARRTLLASLLAGATLMSTGCSSSGFQLASMNPFSKPASAAAEPGPATRMKESIASTATSARNGLGAVGATTKSAIGKTTGAVAGIFNPNKDASDGVDKTDPLRLDNKPEKINPEVFVANGQLWESTGDFTKAMESYSKALESEPNNAPALTSIARLHFRQGNHKQAAEFFQRAISQSPQDAGLYNDLGLTLSKLGDHAGATKALERALQLAPGTSRYANNLASVKFEAGDANSAFQTLATNNKPAVAHFNMAYLYFKSGQMSQAQSHLSEAIRFEPQASGDVAVQRAVDRSRDMLAQIDASMAPIAQAAPQATIAGGQFLANQNAAPQIKQTSQSGASSPASVSPAAPMAPAMSAITPPPSTAAAAPSFVPSSSQWQPPATSQWQPPTSSQWQSQATAPNPNRPTPTKPAEPAAADPSTTPPATTTNSPSAPFSLPSNFTMPESK